MEPLTPQEKLAQHMSDAQYASWINDDEIRESFLCALSGGGDDELPEDDFLHVWKFMTAVNYFLGTLGYAIYCESEEGDPVPMHVLSSEEEQGS